MEVELLAWEDALQICCGEQEVILKLRDAYEAVVNMELVELVGVPKLQVKLCCSWLRRHEWKVVVVRVDVFEMRLAATCRGCSSGGAQWW